MEWIWVPLLLALLIVLSLFLAEKQKQKRVQSLKKQKEKELAVYKDLLEINNNLNNVNKELEDSNKELKLKNDEIVQDLRIKENSLTSIKSQIEDLKRINERLRQNQEEELQIYIENIKHVKLEALEKDLKEWAASSQEALTEESNRMSAALYKEIEELSQTILQFQKEKELYKQEIDIINEENRKKELAQHEIDFHRIILTQEQKDDIHYIVSIIPNLRHKNILNKLIWTEYLQKPFQQMIKNICGADKPRNVIYCIEHIPTHKKYIGKTAQDVSKRWSDHIKTSLGIGDVAKSKIHEALYLHWDEFYFSILENVSPDDNILERERFYIDFFQSNIYGYNIK